MNYRNSLSNAIAGSLDDLYKAQSSMQKTVEQLLQASQKLPEVIDTRYPEDAKQLYLELRQQVVSTQQIIEYLLRDNLSQTAKQLTLLHNLIISGRVQPDNEPLPPQEACDQAVLVFMQACNRPMDLSTMRNELPGEYAGSVLVHQSLQNLLAQQQIVLIGDGRDVYVACHPQELTTEQRQHVDRAREHLRSWVAGDITPEHICEYLERGNQWQKPIRVPYNALYRYMQLSSETSKATNGEGKCNI
jgi:hypothetical protein